MVNYSIVYSVYKLCLKPCEIENLNVKEFERANFWTDVHFDSVDFILCTFNIRRKFNCKILSVYCQIQFWKFQLINSLRLHKLYRHTVNPFNSNQNKFFNFFILFFSIYINCSHFSRIFQFQNFSIVSKRCNVFIEISSDFRLENKNISSFFKTKIPYSYLLCCILQI